jgi:hypothetical protein
MGCQRRLRRIGQSHLLVALLVDSDGWATLLRRRSRALLAVLWLVAAGCACAVQMLLVAFSRRMCCSLVCSERRRAGRPALSTETPTRRPGSEHRPLDNLDNLRPKVADRPQVVARAVVSLPVVSGTRSAIAAGRPRSSCDRHGARRGQDLCRSASRRCRQPRQRLPRRNSPRHQCS